MSVIFSSCFSSYFDTWFILVTLWNSFQPKLYFLEVTQIAHCIKSACIRSHSGPHFLPFGLNTERYSVFLRIQSECGKIRTRIIPNTDTFHVVFIFSDSESDTYPPSPIINTTIEIPYYINFSRENWQCNNHKFMIMGKKFNLF